MDNFAQHIGVDISRDRLDISFLGPNGAILQKHESYANSRTGFEQFKQQVLENIVAYDLSKLYVSAEATSQYWVPFFMQLANDPEINAYDLTQFLLNPRGVKWYKKCFPPNHKTDANDAFYIAEFTRTQPQKHAWHADPAWLPLRYYTRLRFHLVEQLSREKNFCHGYLFLLNCAYGRLKPFSNIFGETSRKVLKDQSQLDTFAQLALADLAEHLDQLSQHHLPAPFKNARILQQIAEERFLPEPEVEEALQFVLNSILEHIEYLDAQIKQVDKRITAEAKKHPEVQILRTIPGIGPVFASGIAAELGNLQRFFDGEKWDDQRKRKRAKNLRDVEACVAKMAGLWWVQSASGNFEAQDRKLGKTGNRYLRYYIVEAADRLRQSIPSYVEYYSRKYAEASKYHHKRALVLIARKSIGLIVGLLHRNEPYCPQEG